MVYLFTYSFQAPGFYRSLGYVVEHTIRGYPMGIERYTMARSL
jgi:ribosomal protein S18 acetylase RimI-like enzyme